MTEKDRQTVINLNFKVLTTKDNARHQILTVDEKESELIIRITLNNNYGSTSNPYY